MRVKVRLRIERKFRLNEADKSVANRLANRAAKKSWVDGIVDGILARKKDWGSNVGGLAMKENGCISLATLSKDLVVARRQTEWKLNFSLWASMLGITAFLLKWSEPERLDHAYPWLCGLFVLTTIFYIVTTIVTSGSNSKDMYLVRFYRSRAEGSNESLPKSMELHPLCYALWGEPLKLHTECMVFKKQRKFLTTWVFTPISRSHVYFLQCVIAVALCAGCLAAIHARFEANPADSATPTALGSLVVRWEPYGNSAAAQEARIDLKQ